MLDHLRFVWMFALHWVEYQYHRILVLKLNANISVWMFRYSERRLDIEVECQMLVKMRN